MTRGKLLFMLFVSVLVVFSISPAKAGTVQLPQTGQTTCYDTSGAVTSCSNVSYPGEDGKLQMGVAWPSPMFTANGDQTLTDNLTKLIWPSDAGTPTVGLCAGGAMTWHGALNYVACLNTNNYLGHSDWRLPNVNELESVFNDGQPDMGLWFNGQGFSNVQPSYYWSSTSYPFYPSLAWHVSMGDGGVEPYGKNLNYFVYVWPVRGGQGTSVIWRTGQTTCYDTNDNVIICTGTGQDGELQEGVAWPSPRFTDNGDQTVTDNLTNLIWTINGSTPTVGPCTSDGTWQAGLNYVVCLNTNNYLGHNDWRLPNRIELSSLTDFSQSAPSIPTGNPFIGVQPLGFYWSSTSYASNPSNAWAVYMANGYVSDASHKVSNNAYVWPIRGGQSGASTYSISGTVESDGSGISGVTVTLSGAVTGTTTTDSNGNYTFNGLTNGSYTVTPSKSGYSFTPDNVTVNNGNSTGDNIIAYASGGGSGTPVGYSPAWLIITIISLTLAGGYLMRKRIAGN